MMASDPQAVREKKAETFVHINNVRSEKGIRKIVLFTIVSKMY
jgi:hypothetical protein